MFGRSAAAAWSCSAAFTASPARLNAAWNAVAPALDDVPVVGLDRRAEARVVLRDEVAHLLGRVLPQARRALDVSEQERHGARRRMRGHDRSANAATMWSRISSYDMRAPTARSSAKRASPSSSRTARTSAGRRSGGTGRSREDAEFAVEDRAQQDGGCFDQAERREDLDRVAARAVEPGGASVRPECRDGFDEL